jgi:transcriptional regulator with XRE-family HTH domain
MQAPDEVAAAIAANVRRLRNDHRLTIDTLAERAGVSKGTIIQLEQGRANPNIGTLCRLSDALQVGVATLVAPVDTSPRMTIRRSAQAAPLWTSDAGSRAAFLIGTDPPNVIELWDWRLVPGDAFDGEAHGDGTVEVLTVHQGALSVSAGGRSETLAVGDSVLFEAYVPHRYANDGSETTLFTMLVLQPADRPLGTPDTIAPVDA